MLLWYQVGTFVWQLSNNYHKEIIEKRKSGFTSDSFGFGADFIKENLEQVGKVLTCITDKKLSMKPSPATNLSMT